MHPGVLVAPKIVVIISQASGISQNEFDHAKSYAKTVLYTSAAACLLKYAVFFSISICTSAHVAAVVKRNILKRNVKWFLLAYYELLV
jgi:hypothetical protein